MDKSLLVPLALGIFLLFATTAAAIGISPPSINVTLSADGPTKVDFLVFNTKPFSTTIALVTTDPAISLPVRSLTLPPYGREAIELSIAPEVNQNARITLVEMPPIPQQNLREAAILQLHLSHKPSTSEEEGGVNEFHSKERAQSSAPSTITITIISAFVVLAAVAYGIVTIGM